LPKLKNQAKKKNQENNFAIPLHLYLFIFELMKFIAIILSLLILALSIKPCSDRNNAENEHKKEMIAEHNHQNDIDDTCSITCICSCCGIAITYQPIQTFELGIDNLISTEILSVYQSVYRFNYYFNIWQPPQLVS